MSETEILPCASLHGSRVTRDLVMRLRLLDCLDTRPDASWIAELIDVRRSSLGFVTALGPGIQPHIGSGRGG